MKNITILLALFLYSSVIFAQTDSTETRTQLVIDTDSGSIKVELYNETPIHRDNFIKLAKEGFYDGIAFHRVINDFMIQGGNPATRGESPSKRDNPGYTLPSEFNPAFIHKKGALCAARQPDNVNPNRASSGSQFYIVEGRPFEEKDLINFQDKINFDMRNQVTRAFFSAEENKEYLQRLRKAKKEQNQDDLTAVLDEVNPIIEAKMAEKEFSYTEEQTQTYETIGGAPHLDMQYTIFGEVLEGLDVVEKIAACKKKGYNPDPAIRMSVRVIE